MPARPGSYGCQCPPGRARPRDVVARSQVADTLCVDAGENVCFSPFRSARSSMGERPYVRYGSKADFGLDERNVR